MSAYFFHTTDGSSVDVDQQGLELSGRRAARAKASERACAFMAERGPSLDWSQWAVHVYDALGEEVAVLPFPDAEPQRTGRAPRRTGARGIGQRIGRTRDRVGPRVPR